MFNIKTDLSLIISFKVITIIYIPVFYLDFQKIYNINFWLSIFNSLPKI